MAAKGILTEFHQANIHETRATAVLSRGLPIALFLTVLTTTALAAVLDSYLFVLLCSCLNLLIWLWIVGMALEASVACFCVNRSMNAYDDSKEIAAEEQFFPLRTAVAPVHVICIPNYKEPEACLSETLESLSQADGSSNFVIVLAMEQREKIDGEEKALRLQERYAKHFKRFFITNHPGNLEQRHLDNSVCAEVPGKASNLKWAVRKAHEECGKDGDLSGYMDRLILTVADADCLFHPGYFQAVGADFDALSKDPTQDELMTMWQAPQVNFRNFQSAPMPSRAWGYLSSTYETSGSLSLFAGQHHMNFSAYTLSLVLGVNGDLWDGDVIAEDHHAFLKAFFHSVHESAKKAVADPDGLTSCRSTLKVRPVFLPVKCTLVEADTTWEGWSAKLSQSIRHAQGLAELSYAALCTWDLFCTLPLRFWNLQLVRQLVRLFACLFCMHLMPLLQGVALAILTIYWTWHGHNVPACPHELSEARWDTMDFVCATAGAWVQLWPVVVPVLLLLIVNWYIITSIFLNPHQRHLREGKSSEALWFKEDGHVEPTCGSTRLTLMLFLIVDFTLFVPIMTAYGFIPYINALWNVLFYGNDFNYITAAKGPVMDYRTMEEGAKPASPSDGAGS